MQDIKEKKSFDVPILFVVFNKPEATKRVFEMIRKVRPARLLIAADGSRDDKAGEREKTELVRKTIENIDWPCEVKRKYSDKNLGCKTAVSSAINWFFENVDEGIVLEDDCLPCDSFFCFCENLLEKYRNDDRIKMISGTSLLSGRNPPKYSYYFSNFPQIWGWATWKRAWKEYDIQMQDYPEFKKEGRIASIFADKRVQRYFLNIYNKLYDNKIDTWDGQWAYAIHNHKGLSVIPSHNLVSNIGYGEGATHTKIVDKLSNMPTEEIVDIYHPDKVEVDIANDKEYADIIIPSLAKRLWLKVMGFADLRTKIKR